MGPLAYPYKAVPTVKVVPIAMLVRRREREETKRHAPFLVAPSATCQQQSATRRKKNCYLSFKMIERTLYIAHLIVIFKA